MCSNLIQLFSILIKLYSAGTLFCGLLGVFLWAQCVLYCMAAVPCADWRSICGWWSLCPRWRGGSERGPAAGRSPRYGCTSRLRLWSRRKPESTQRHTFTLHIHRLPIISSSISAIKKRSHSHQITGFSQSAVGWNKKVPWAHTHILSMLVRWLAVREDQQIYVNKKTNPNTQSVAVTA